jgi:hypothetical protein
MVIISGYARADSLSLDWYGYLYGIKNDGNELGFKDDMNEWEY